MTQHNRLAFIAAMVIVTSTVQSAQSQGIYDASTDFSSSSNPNGVWQYGSEPTLGASFSPLPTQIALASGSVTGWGTSETFPFVVKNQTAGPVFDGTTTYTTDVLAMHPSSSGVLSVVRWTAPAAGLYTLSATFSDISNDEAATVDIHVLKNNVALFDGLLNASSPSQSYSIQISTLLGDTIDFAVGFGNGSFSFDHTALSAQIQAVPEPGGIALLLIGALLHSARRVPNRLTKRCS